MQSSIQSEQVPAQPLGISDPASQAQVSLKSKSGGIKNARKRATEGGEKKREKREEGQEKKERRPFKERGEKKEQ